MRYRIEQEHVEKKEHASQLIVDTTVFLTLLIGILFIFLGRKGAQYWLTVWGIITIVISIVYYAYNFSLL